MLFCDPLQHFSVLVVECCITRGLQRCHITIRASLGHQSPLGHTHSFLSVRAMWFPYIACTRSLLLDLAKNYHQAKKRKRTKSFQNACGWCQEILKC